MDEKYTEILLGEIRKKLSKKTFCTIVIISSLINFDIHNSILQESIRTLQVTSKIAAMLFIVYYFYIRKKVSKYESEHDEKRFSNDVYDIYCDNFKLTIIHNLKRILYNQEPILEIEIYNDTTEIIENIEGYIDLFFHDKCIIHQNVHIDYVLPHKGMKQKLLDDDRVYYSWDTGKFIMKLNNEKKIYSGITRYIIPDFDYILKKDIALFIIKSDITRIYHIINNKWKNNCVYKILIIIVTIILMIFFGLLLYTMIIEIYNWSRLHIETYLI